MKTEQEGSMNVRMNPDLDDLVRIKRSGGMTPMIFHPFLSNIHCVVASEVTESLDFDGLCLIPTWTIDYFDRDFEAFEFYRAAVSTWAPSKNDELLGQLTCDLVDDLRLLARLGELVALHTEIEHPDAAYVGTVRDVSKTRLLLDRVSPRGKRIAAPLKVEVRALTKVEVSTRYLRAVRHAVGVLDARALLQ